MAQVNVTISGKTYRMACDDGEEQHLADLAERLDRSIEQLRQRFGEIGDQRLTVMASLTFADQAAEAERRIAHLERHLAESERARLAAAEQGSSDVARTASAIEAVAERIESLAGRVGGGSVGPKSNGGQ